MAQQTINVGTSPNDGTGTPLRTAFQYTNSNFSELYTAVGPSGNNIVVPGTATLASATINGALTVQAATARPTIQATSNGTGSTLRFIGKTNAGVTTDFEHGINLATNSAFELYDNVNGQVVNRYVNTGTHSWFLSGSTAMTLNSTGLGVGASPGYKLHVGGYSSANIAPDVAIVRSSSGTTIQSGPNLIFNDGTSTNNIVLQNTQGRFGIWNYGAGSWIERLSVDSSGNVGVGVTPSAWGSNSKALQVGGGTASVSSTGAGSTASRFAHGAYFDNTNWLYQYTGVGPALYQVTGANAGSTHAWYIAPGGTAGNAITFTQAMTLDASGNLGVGTTNPAAVFGTVRSGFVATGASGAIGAKVDATGRACLIAWNADTAGDNNFVQFFTEATLTSRGSITYNRGAGQVAYNITSDYRLKEDIKPLTGAVNRIASLKPSTYKLKETGSACEGFIAHELAEVVPMAVTGTKDAVDADGKPVYQAVDLSKVTPLLVAAIQELTARVEALEAK